MTNDNPCYRRGALWKTRTRIIATIDNKSNSKLPSLLEIPRGEMIMLLFYEMNISYEESIIFLWKERICSSLKVDTGFAFDLDPDGINTQKNNS